MIFHFVQPIFSLRAELAKSEDQELIEAVINGNFGGFFSALRNGANINVRDDQGNTALIWAARSINPAIVAEILDMPDSNLTIRNNKGKSAYDYAVERNADSAKMILKALERIKEEINKLIRNHQFNNALLAFKRRGIALDAKLTSDNPESAIEIAGPMLLHSQDKVRVSAGNFLEKLYIGGARKDWSVAAVQAVKARDLRIFRLCLEGIKREDQRRQESAMDRLVNDVLTTEDAEFARTAFELLSAEPAFSGPTQSNIVLAARYPELISSIYFLEILSKKRNFRDLEADMAIAAAIEAYANGADKNLLILDFLFKQGADAKSTRIHLENAFQAMTQIGWNEKLITTILDNGARLDAAPKKDNMRSDPNNVVVHFFNYLYNSIGDLTDVKFESIERVLQKMVQQGVNIEAKDSFGFTPLLKVIHDKKYPGWKPLMLNLLDSLGAKIWYTDKKDKSPICASMFAPESWLIERLLSFKSFDPQKFDGESPYLCAQQIARGKPGSIQRRREVIKALLNGNFPVDSTFFAREISRIIRGGGDIEIITLVKNRGYEHPQNSVIDKITQSLPQFPENREVLKILQASGE